MKTQRTNNPRFLGALGFLGFLGFLGSRNPDVTRWAWLSLLSYFSLLVLLPTQDASTATYTLNPKRKWMLLFLGCLGFLGFLGREGAPFVGLSMLSILSQMAIDRKKEGMPLKELRYIFMLLVFAVILPLGGMVWFMTAAVRNEQMAVRQRLSEVYRSQLTTSADRINSEILRMRTELGEHADLPTPQRFDALLRKGGGDSILIFGDNQTILYPGDATGNEGEGVSADVLAIQSEVRRTLSEGAFEEARAKIEQLEADVTLRKSRDKSGRMLLPALQLFFVQSAPESQAGGVLQSLQKTATDYSLGIAPARRLFYLQALAQLGTEVEPWLTAEMLLAELEGFLGDIPPPTALGLGIFHEKEAYLLYNFQGDAASILKQSRLIELMQEQVDTSVAIEGVHIILEKEFDRQERKPFLQILTPAFGSGWYLNLYTTGDDPFSDTADRQIVRYVWIGNMVIVGMIFVFVLLVRSLLAQQRLTKMKNDFVATVTHELKTPLASTRMLVDTLLEGRCRDEQQQREYLELVARENRRLSRLIDNFLTFSRMERNKRAFDLQPTAPGEIALTAVETVHENFEQCGCSLSVEIEDGLPMIPADRDSMVQVLLNLLDNACKYSDGDKRIDLRVYAAEQAVCFAVSDKGTGMNRRELSKIFTRFYQVDQTLTRKVGGAGLGLSIVHFIVEAHGGKIEVESELGNGSTFTVKIPADHASAAGRYDRII